MRTWLQSQSSSSATIIGSEVFTPWPISGFLETIVTVPSVAMETKAESCAGAVLFSPVAPSASAGSGISASSASPPPARREALSSARRSSPVADSSCNTAGLLFLHACGNPNGAADPVVTAAAAEVAGHCRVELIVVGPAPAGEQCTGRHDLSGLTIAALHHIDLQPRLLQALAEGSVTDVLDGVDLGIADVAHRQLAGALRRAIHVYRAAATETLAASVLGPDEPQLIAQHPQQRHLRWNIYLADRAVDIESVRHTCSRGECGTISLPLRPAMNRRRRKLSLPEAPACPTASDR